MTRLCIVLCLLASLFAVTAAAGEWTGYISDSHCGARHMDGSEQSANCVKSCVKGGAKLVFVAEDKKVLTIANPEAVAETYHGKKVKVTGEVKADTLTVKNITAG